MYTTNACSPKVNIFNDLRTKGENGKKEVKNLCFKCCFAEMAMPISHTKTKFKSLPFVVITF